MFSMSSFPYIHLGGHFLALRVLIELSRGVHLEVNELATGKVDDDLTLIHGAAHDGLLTGSLPLVHSLLWVSEKR